MNRALMIGVAAVALVLGALLGYLGSGPWSDSRQGELKEALEKSTRLERQVTDLRAENDRIAADLQREKEMSRRLQMLVSEGKK